MGVLLILIAIPIAGESLESKSSLQFYDLGVGEPSNFGEGDTRFLGEDSLSVTIINNGDLSGVTQLDFLLERNENSEWVEVDSGGNGPYEIDPEAWVESFFDVCYEFEGEYRATFSLDTPIGASINSWEDDNPSNDVYQVEFQVIKAPKYHLDIFVEFEITGDLMWDEFLGFYIFASESDEMKLNSTGLFGNIKNIDVDIVIILNPKFGGIEVNVAFGRAPAIFAISADPSP